MDESMRHDIALFRYGLIAPLVNGQVEPKAYLKEVSERVHHVPHQGDKMFPTRATNESQPRRSSIGAPDTKKGALTP